MVVEVGISSYAANLIALNFEKQPLLIKSFAGDATIETAGVANNENRHTILTNRIFAWPRRDNLGWLTTTVAPLFLALVAIASNNIALLVASVIMAVSLLTLLYVSCRVVSERGLMVTLSTIIDNFYRSIFDKFKKNHYLYERSRVVSLPNTKRKDSTSKIRENHNLQL
jgi:hypothetical protein